MPKVAKNAQDNMVEHLNRVLALDGPMTFQKVLLNYACSRHELTRVAEQAGARRESIWRYRTGETAAPLETLVKIIAVVGAKLVIISDQDHQ
jgi:DNA-binding phage protein